MQNYKMDTSAFAANSGTDRQSNASERSADPHGNTRERWATRFDFLLACVGCTIAYGTIWRFPYLVYQNGGVAFLIPYLISVLLFGIPIFFLEVMQGQFVGGAAVKVWKMVPIFGGIVFPSLVILGVSICLFSALQTWSIRYLLVSFTWDFPWASCDNEWNTEYCVIGRPEPLFGENNAIIGYQSSRNKTVVDDRNLTDSANEFWYNRVLAMSNGPTEVGSIRPDLLGCLFVAWLVVFLCIFKGFRTAGRLMYFTVPASLLAMVILAIRGLTLPGAWQGVAYYMYPDFGKLNDISVWAEAAKEVFYSYSVSLGILHALGSFNPWHHGSFRDTLIFSAIHTLISIVAGFLPFAMFGFLAYSQNTSVDRVVNSGLDVAYTAIPKALALMPYAPVWAVMFFSMLLLNGLDSAFVSVGAFIAAVYELLPNKLKETSSHETVVVTVTCLVFPLVSLAMITNGGLYVFRILDYLLNYRIFMLVAMLECLAVGWIYGSFRFFKNMEVMSKTRMFEVVKVTLAAMWNVVTPLFVLIQFIILSTLSHDSSLTFYKNNEMVYELPFSATLALAWVPVALCFLSILLVAGYRILTAESHATLWERIRYPTLPILKSSMVLPGASPGSYVLEPDETVPDPESKDLLAGAHDERL